MGVRGDGGQVAFGEFCVGRGAEDHLITNVNPSKMDTEP